ncbi:MAG TPA: response regulator [Candidatus Bathyarchaeia archaeon]|nr:response regulator [Candidatus Bathyarchaeia archaeon]
MTDEKRPRILIVDDDDIIRETYLQVFGQRGFETTGAKDGVEGIDSATKQKFDVILTGIIMPRMDGFQLISALRENVETKDVPVAIISHLGREEDRRRAAEMGIENFIVQGSMTPREVADKLKSLVSVQTSFQMGIDYGAWDAPLLAKKMGFVNFECPNCRNKLIFELSSKSEGKGFDAFFKCPKCDLNL